jgi:hypothetical protein
MNTRILLAAAIASFVSPIAFAQMGGYGGGMTQSQSPRTTGGQSQQMQTTTTKTTTPVGVKGYLGSQMASSSDKKFHLTVQGKDLALTPTRIHEAKKLDARKSATIVDMKAADGKMYEVEFETSNGQVTGASVLVRKSKMP